MINMIRLKGKIIRDEDCPIKKTIMCEDCPFYDGWGVDVKTYKMHIYCTNQNIINRSKLTLTNEQYRKYKKSNIFIRFIKKKKKR